jgi:uncharacterized membrane protein
MIFLGVLLAASAVLVLVDLSLGRPVDPRRDARRGLGVALVVAGGAHFVMPTPFLQHLPAWVPAASALVAATGAIEVLLGGGLLARDAGTQRVAGRLSAGYLIAVFPANVYVAVAGIDVAGQPGGLYPWLRLPLQGLFVAWALWSTSPPAHGTGEPVLGWLPAVPWAYGLARRTTADTTTVQGSLLELRRYRDVPGFLIAAVLLRATFRRAPGAVRLSLRAVPSRRMFWTLSQWETEHALRAYVGHPRHRKVMRTYGPRLRRSHFTTWSVPATRPPSWVDAHRKILSQIQTGEHGRAPAHSQR